MPIKYFLENEEWKLERASDGASGFDIRAVVGTEREIAPWQRWLVPTGLYLAMPVGVEAQVRSRSGLAINHGVIVLNAPGTVDSDYRGEIKVSLINLSEQPYKLVPGERIAQIVFCPVIIPDGRGGGNVFASALQRVDAKHLLGETKRGEGGHGSTGR